MNRSGFAAKLVLYGASSALALIVDVGLLWGLSSYFGVNYLLSAGIGFSVGCAVNYVVSKTIVFEDNSARRETTTLFLFVVVGVIGLVMNHFILFVSVELLSLHLLIAKAISAMLVFWFNFLARGYFVFKDPDLHTNRTKKILN
jgi:putative flippase GtrA